jgi:predicted amidohydrolase YtcJ
LAIKDGIILAVGDNEQVLASQGSTTEIIDLEGITVVPSFIDAHSHFAGVAAIDQLIRLLEKLNSMIGGRDHRTVMIHG